MWIDSGDRFYAPMLPTSALFNHAILMREKTANNHYQAHAATREKCGQQLLNLPVVFVPFLPAKTFPFPALGEQMTDNRYLS